MKGKALVEKTFPLRISKQFYPRENPGPEGLSRCFPGNILTLQDKQIV